MSDIFISYKREEQPVAKKLADALEDEGWTVWWDPKLRAGQHFDDVIEKALTSAKCVVVLWSGGSVKSQYVRDEATYALERKKLVPVAIEPVETPFRFRGVHTLKLFAWDGSRDSPDFRRLVADISATLGDSSKVIRNHIKQTEDDHFREQGGQWSEKEATRQVNRSNIAQKYPWRKYRTRAGAVVLLLIIFSFVFWWANRQATQQHALDCPSAPEQTRKDWEVEVKTAVGKIGPARGADLEARTKAVTKDLMSKLPQADKVYLEQMM